MEHSWFCPIFWFFWCRLYLHFTSRYFIRLTRLWNSEKIIHLPLDKIIQISLSNNEIVLLHYCFNLTTGLYCEFCKLFLNRYFRYDYIFTVQFIRVSFGFLRNIRVKSHQVVYVWKLCHHRRNENHNFPWNFWWLDRLRSSLNPVFFKNPPCKLKVSMFSRVFVEEDEWFELGIYNIQD